MDTPEPAPDILPRGAIVRELLRPVMQFVARVPNATDVYVNRPGEVWVESGRERMHFEAPELTFERCLALATSIARYTNQAISPASPILSAQMPDGSRIQIQIPPSVEDHTVALAIRIPGSVVRSLDDYEREGAFSRFVWARSRAYEAHRDDLEPVERELFELLCEKNLCAFLKRAVLARMTIGLVGETGSGKTALMNACAALIPTFERVYTMEDAHEVKLAVPNRVHAFYSQGGQGAATLTPSDLLTSGLRMNPDRFLLGELRGAPALDLLDALQTGHGGSMTTWHAGSVAEAYERFWSMCILHPKVGHRSHAEVDALARRLIPIIVHMASVMEPDPQTGELRRVRYVKEVHYDPVAVLRARLGDAVLVRAGG